MLTLIRNVISDAKLCGRKVGICGQAPSDHEGVYATFPLSLRLKLFLSLINALYPIGFAEMLVDAGIDSISLNPDSVLKVRQRLAKHESRKTKRPEHDKLSEMKASVETMKEPKQAHAQ